MKKTFLRSAAMIGFMALWSAGSMRADLIPFLCGDDPVGTACGATPGVIELGPNDYQYNYTVELTAGEFTQTSNDVATQTYVTIYDIPGYIAGTATAGTAPFSTSVQAMGITPSSPMAGCCTPIDTSLPNVTWTATTDVDARNTPIFYTGFSFQSTMGPKLVEGVYNDQAGKDNTTNSGTTTFDDNTGPVRLPSGGSVPEPTSMTFMGLGLAALTVGIARRVRI